MTEDHVDIRKGTLDFSQQFKALYVLHAQVRQHNPVVFFTETLERFSAAIHCSDLVAPLLKDVTDQLPHLGLIIHHEYRSNFWRHGEMCPLLDSDQRADVSDGHSLVGSASRVKRGARQTCFLRSSALFKRWLTYHLMRGTGPRTLSSCRIRDEGQPCKVRGVLCLRKVDFPFTFLDLHFLFSLGHIRVQVVFFQHLVKVRTIPPSELCGSRNVAPREFKHFF